MDKRGLKEFINMHFTYEIEELMNARFFLTSAKNGDVIYSIDPGRFQKARTLGNMGNELGRISMNLGLEHALLHSRILFEFYFRHGYDDNGADMNPRRYPRANMYVPGFRANAKNIPADFWDKVNNQITHLGWDRFEEPEKKFNYAQTMDIIKDLLSITKQFIGQLGSEFKTGELKNLADGIKT